MTDSRRVWALLALTAILVITAAWWALALWPLSSEPAEWLIRTRLACFGSTASGLPDGGGWLLLFGQPLGMLIFLLAAWGRVVREGLAGLAARPAGRVAIGVVTVTLAVGGGAAGRRVAAAGPVVLTESPPVADTPRRNDVPAPLRLRAQDGRMLELAAFAGRPVVVTFAYAHCETVCPLLVRDVLAAARAAKPRPVVLVVSLDPWRDTPARLPAVARQWGLGADEYILSGSVAEVQATLEDWGVRTARDASTGEVVHPRVAWLVDAGGRAAFVGDGSTGLLTAQLARL